MVNLHVSMIRELPYGTTDSDRKEIRKCRETHKQNNTDARESSVRMLLPEYQRHVLVVMRPGAYTSGWFASGWYHAQTLDCDTGTVKHNVLMLGTDIQAQTELQKAIQQHRTR